jgi:hypothetical protein
MHKLAEDQSEIRRLPALDRNHIALARDRRGAGTLPGKSSHQSYERVMRLHLSDHRFRDRVPPSTKRWQGLFQENDHEDDSRIDSGIGHRFFSTCTGHHVRLCGIRRAGGARGHYCLTFDTRGSDCGFTSYEQCLGAAALMLGLAELHRDRESAKAFNAFPGRYRPRLDRRSPARGACVLRP